MPDSPLAGTDQTSPTLADRPTRAAKPAVAIGDESADGRDRSCDGGERTILPDLRGGLELARGVLCDLDLDVVLGAVHYRRC
jgi:hypothetical protein